MSALHSAITSVTHNIPSILRDPAVALIGERCYGVLVYDFNISHTDCLKYALSKGLGLGIVLGGGIVKIPQILETTSYAISLAYASRNKFPFSTYGENFFLTIQNVVITLLILYFSGSRGLTSGLGGPQKPLSSGQSRGDLAKVIAGLAISVATGVVLWSENLCPPGILGLLQAATLPISLLSKAPQIIINQRNHSTGNLSAFAVFNALLGCLARLFTTKQEVDDPLVFWGFAGAALLNAVLAVQMVSFWESGEERDIKAKSARRRSAEDGVLENAQGKVGFEESGTPGRRWTRKLD